MSTPRRPTATRTPSDDDYGADEKKTDRSSSLGSVDLAAVLSSSSPSSSVSVTTDVSSPRYAPTLFDASDVASDDEPDVRLSRITHPSQIGLRMPLYRLHYFALERLQIQGF